MHTAIRAATAIAFILTSSAAFADCDYREPRTAELDAAGATKAVIAAGAGDLTVRGATGNQLRVRAEACAESKDVLREIKLAVKREGTTLFVTALFPEGLGKFEDGSLDMIIDLPATLTLEIADSSGDVEVVNVAALQLDDSSGDCVAHDINGHVRITDSSGDVRVKTIRGDVAVTDSSGDVLIEEVTGDVAIPIDSSGELVIRRVHGAVRVMNDSSGDISITAVDKNVFIDRDSSGDIRVVEVGGKLTVSRDSSGDIEHRSVIGEVSLPSSKDDDEI